MSVQDEVLKKIYTTTWGRLLLKPLICKPVSEGVGNFLSQPISMLFVPPFMAMYHMDITDCEKTAREFHSYNDFFTRKLKAEARPMDYEKNHVISPCDSKLTVYPITEDRTVTVKHTEYTVASLLRDAKLAEKYQGGLLCLFRLSVDDYHRYCYIADGIKTSNRRIEGVYHTVNPIANDCYPIYKENAREYSLLRTANMGDVLMMEVGALLVGKIVNHHQKAKVTRGLEKGYFEFGGSTILLLFEKNTICVDEEIMLRSKENIETKVSFGAKIGTVCKK